MASIKLKKVIADNALTGTDEEILVALTDKAHKVPKNIDVIDIKRYLMLSGKYLAIKDSNTDACRLVIEAFDTFDAFDMSDPTNAVAISAQMDGLVTDGAITADDKAFILSMGEATLSLADINGLSKIRIGDIQKARAL